MVGCVIVFCLWILQSAIRNPQFAYFVVCANTDCFHLLHSITLPLPLSITLPLPLSITLPLPLSITLPFSTLDYATIYHSRFSLFLKSNGKRPPSYASFSFTPSLPPNSPTNNAHIAIYFIKQCALPTQNGAHINRRT